MNIYPPSGLFNQITRVGVLIVLSAALLLALPTIAHADEAHVTPTPTTAPPALVPIDNTTSPLLASLLQPLPALDPQLEAWREATYLLGEGDRLNQAGQIAAAREKWLAAAKEYENAESGVDLLKVYGQISESYIWEAYRTFDPSKARLGIEYGIQGVSAGAEIYDDLMREYHTFDQVLLRQAKARYIEGADHCNAGRYRQGIPLLTEAFQIYESAEYGPGEILALMQKSACQVDSGNVFGALISMGQGLEIAQNIPSGDETTELYWQGREQYERGDLQGALATFQKVLDQRQQQGWPRRSASTLLALGYAYEDLGNYLEAEKLYQQALPIYIEAEDEYADFNEALTRYNLANIALFTGRYAEAVTGYTHAIQSWQQIGKPFEEAMGLNALAMAWQGQGKHREALGAVGGANAIYQKLPPNPKFEAYLLHNQGSIHFSHGHYQAARQFFASALALLRKEPFRDYQEMQVQNNIAAIDVALGQFDAAIALYQQVLDFALQQQRPTMVALARFNLAGIYIQQDKLQAGIATFLDLLPVFQQQQMRPDEARTLQNIGAAYLKIGNLREAEVYLQQALPHFQAMQASGYIASVQNNLGVMTFLAHRFTEATTYYEAALATLRSQNDLIGMSRALSNLSLVAAAQHDFQKAKQRGEEALIYSQQAGAQVEQVKSLVLLGMIDLALGLDEQAYQRARTALTLADQMGDPLTAIGGCVILAVASIERGELTTAYQQVHRAIALLETFQGNLTVPELKSAFLGQAADIYSVAAFLAIQQGEPAQAFYYAEQGRARAFLDQLGNHRITPSKNNALLAQQEVAVRQRIAQLQTSLHDAQNQALDQVAAVAPLQTALESARTEYTRLLTHLKLADPEYAALVSVAALTLEELQTQVLDEQTTLISYYTFDDQLSDKTFAWVIDRQHAQLVPLEITQTELKRSVRVLSDFVATQDFSKEQAAQLYQSLFAPLRPFIRHTNLIIIPHHALHYLPFAALWNAETERYLLEEYTITYAPSASALQFLAAQQNADLDHALVLGNPDGSLPNAALEAAAVAQILGTEPLLGPQATENQLWQQAGTIDLLHLAAHGVYDPFSPLFTYIELAPDEDTDGRLTVHEILTLDLADVSLVVLSACETAVGEQNNGDEIVSLTRAFLYAGASSVVSSLWQIDDSASARLMNAFYRNLRIGMTTAEALKAAQLEILQKEQWQSPYYWAAFGLHGNYGPTQN